MGLAAESFTDPEAYAGTCYKASNWEAVGLSAGHSRHRADFYVPNGRPKKLWLKPLCPEGREQLRALQVPQDCKRGLLAAPTGTLPLDMEQTDSLLEVFRRAPDRIHPALPLYRQPQGPLTAHRSFLNSPPGGS